MPTESARPLTRQLLRVVFGTPDVPDHDLLARFIASRDDEAFAEIVQRHGPMVLAVCRRVTGRPHDAEDAFQATFLVLARRAKHVKRPEQLANWLYGVAYRTALEARTIRRRTEERVVLNAPEPTVVQQNDGIGELRRVIDEELAKLPEKYRTAVVLCDLEGLSRTAAAAQMGIPEGTLSSRLAHARKVLADRLTRRGITASVTALTAVLGSDAVTAIPHSLMNLTVLAAVRFAPGGFVPPGISPTVSSLTEEVLKTMLATRLKLLFAFGLLACTLIGGGVFAQQLRPAQDESVGPPSTELRPGDDAKPKPPKEKKEEKKVGTKGIEDDDVPSGEVPSQAVVRIEDGKLLVRVRVHYYEPFTQQVNGGFPVTSYQQKVRVQSTTHDAADVSVFDMKGNRLAVKEWKEKFQKDERVLITYDEKLPNPRQLKLFRPETLIVVLPAPPANLPVPPAPPKIQNLPPPLEDPTKPGKATPDDPLNQPKEQPPEDFKKLDKKFLDVPWSKPKPPMPLLLPPKELPEGIRGTVTKAFDIKNNVMEIDIGADTGLEKGMKLTVYRLRSDTTARKPPGALALEILGTVTMKEVNPKSAMCEFKPKRNVAPDELREEEFPQKGDNVGILKFW